MDRSTETRGGTLQTSLDTPTNLTRPILKQFPAGAPRGSWPAEEFAAPRRAEGQNVTIVMNLATDTFNVVKVVSA